GPLHGYAIMQQAAELSDGRVRFSTGTLYGALKRLLDSGWIAREEDASPDASGRGRKTYRLTADGKLILTAEAQRLQALAAVARQRLNEEPA
ncbi:MAG: PadR family transcriptional regulator, partial [Chloroflexi bacterium]|nr:PadR family transcriptional regulator [Chloroflexota bacterium]